jgi:hypothetical protein
VRSVALCAGVAITIALGTPAAAQDASDAVARCAALADQDAEIACLRAALQGRATPEQAVPAPPAQVQPPARPAPLASATPPSGLGAEQVAPPEPAPGAEREGPPRERIAAAVTDHRTDVRGHLVVQLDNGQIWRQVEIDGSPIRLGSGSRPGAVAVEITPSGFGGYRMDIPEIGRRIAVSRLR